VPARNSESLAWQAHTKTPNTLYGIGNLPGMMSCGRRQFRYYLLTIYHPEIAVPSDSGSDQNPESSKETHEGQSMGFPFPRTDRTHRQCERRVAKTA
jgi:hypothetical protein